MNPAEDDDEEDEEVSDTIVTATVVVAAEEVAEDEDVSSSTDALQPASMLKASAAHINLVNFCTFKIPLSIRSQPTTWTRHKRKKLHAKAPF